MTSPRCQMCHRELTNPESIKNGIGPECAEKMQSFIGTCGTSMDEIATLTLLDEPTVTRFVTLFGRAMGAGNIRHAKQFLGAARRAAQIDQIEIAA